MPVQLFPNWVVKWVRNPNLRTKMWLNRPVEVFHVSPKMTKFEIKEYHVKLYNLPVTHVHTAIYNGRRGVDRTPARVCPPACAGGERRRSLTAPRPIVDGWRRGH